MKEKKRFEGHVEWLRIPKEALADWIKELLEGGHNAATVERILEKISPDYRKMSFEEQVELMMQATANWFEREAAEMPPDIDERIRLNLRKAMEKKGITNAETE